MLFPIRDQSQIEKVSESVVTQTDLWSLQAIPTSTSSSSGQTKTG